MYGWCTQRALWPIYRCPQWQTSMIDEGLCPHSLRNQTLWYHQLCNVCGNISRWRSPGEDKIGFEDLRGRYGVIYGWGNCWIVLLEAATNFLKVFNMAAAMTRQDGRVELEQSDMRLALNTAQMAKGGFAHAAIEETQQLIKKPFTEVREEKMRGVEFPGHRKVKAVMERHPAMVYTNHKDGYLPCQYGTGKIPQTSWRGKQTGAPPPVPVAPAPRMPPLPRMPLRPPGDSEGTRSYKIEGMPSRCVYIHSPLPNTQFFIHNAYAKHSKREKDFFPDLLSTLSATWQYHWHCV